MGPDDGDGVGVRRLRGGMGEACGGREISRTALVDALRGFAAGAGCVGGFDFSVPRAGSAGEWGNGGQGGGKWGPGDGGSLGGCGVHVCDAGLGRWGGGSGSGERGEGWSGLGGFGGGLLGRGLSALALEHGEEHVGEGGLMGFLGFGFAVDGGLFEVHEKPEEGDFAVEDGVDEGVGDGVLAFSGAVEQGLGEAAAIPGVERAAGGFEVFVFGWAGVGEGVVEGMDGRMRHECSRKKKTGRWGASRGCDFLSS